MHNPYFHQGDLKETTVDSIVPYVLSAELWEWRDITRIQMEFNGLLGRHIATQLRDRRDTVFVLDIVKRFDDIPFFQADISDDGAVLSVLKKCGATCVIHNASPPATIAKPSLFWKVNVDGTKAIVAACIEAGVKKLIFTSSSAVVFDGSDLNNIVETQPYTTKPANVYMETKIHAEKIILDANGKNGLSTVILRPSGIFGPGDRQLIAGLYSNYLAGRTNIQIGNNKNLTDWTPVQNVADAHILAADRLSNPVSKDQPVAGQIFFITNDDPWYFWDFTNAVWDRLDIYFPGKRQKKSPIIIPSWFGMILGNTFELIGWISGQKPAMNRFTIAFSCAARWHNITKAKTTLGYKPRVAIKDELDELVKAMVDEP
ncbi:hypothetical protein D9758_010536 [Tetrapyrgos nigripes]|uniref:3-beta hydroxysteroid dehydrogenase/isomerase domain-containing protein n=1 Tax=Tetrapyrgos nigripes TaxID=182062 RepID=A0A8H5FVQ4_9AGAR|nr:hypothetical protein D9758_010536 [Tetrapyrgos nigripes]